MRRTPTALVGCVLLAACGQGPAEDTTATVTAAPPADAVPLDGDTVNGSGRLVQEPGGPVLFCGNELRNNVGYAPGREPAPAACRDGIALEGADLAAVSERFEKAGAVDGYASVTGIWRAGTVLVREQGPPAVPGSDSALTEVPCPEPTGGWPVTSERDGMEAEMARVHQSGRLRVGPDRFALLLPSKNQRVLGYAVPDEASRVQAQAALDELVPNRACVVVAEHTDTQVQAARAVDWVPFGGVRSYGVGLRRMQAVLHVSVLVVTEAMVADAGRHPEGLVELIPDLRVVAVADRPKPQQEPAAAPQEPDLPRPPRPDELGPDGDLLPGTPKHQEREAARAEYEALVARQTAAAQALAPEVDAHVRSDPRVGDLLERATYDLASALPVGQPAVGASLTYTLPAPRDFRYVYADFDGTQSDEDPVAVAEHFGATQVTVIVNFQAGRILGLRLDGSADVTTYDAAGNVLLDSRQHGDGAE